MEFLKIKEILFNELKPKLESNNGLAIFARERAKFEGWLKVESCEILTKYFTNIIPEKDRIDITFNDWAIELKTLNTNITYENVKNKHRPITMNINSVISDIENLKLTSYANKGILFIAFPIEHNNPNWQLHLNRIKNKLMKIEYIEFCFSNGTPGVIYLGKI
jgi:hypothetical protein